MFTNRVFVLLFFATSLIACTLSPHATPEKAEKESGSWSFRAFKVSPELAPEVATTIRQLLWLKEGVMGGKTQVSPTGDAVIVAAPKDILDGVGNWIDGLKTGTAPAPAKNLRLEVWSLLARPSKEMSLSRDLAPVAEVTRALERELGPSEITLYDRIQTVSRSREYQTLSTERTTALEARARISGDHIEIDIDKLKSLLLKGPPLSLRLNLAPGVPVVLAALGADPAESVAAEGNRRTLIYVLRVTPM
jgi:hypothetical protein